MPPITGEYVDPAMPDMIRRADIVVILLDLMADPLTQYEETLAALDSYHIYPEGTVLPESVRKAHFIRKTFVVANKMDTEKQKEDFETFLELTGLKLPSIGISIQAETNLQEFLRIIFELSEVIRVYAKNPGKEPDLEEPFVMAQDSTLEELAVKIHKDIARNMKFARVWGKAVHGGQMVQRDYVLQDEDIIEIHI